MYCNSLFGPREDHNYGGEMQDQSGPSEPGNRIQKNTIQAQKPFQNANWNGLSPRNRENQAHYQSLRESAPPPTGENEEWPESDPEPPITRKRLASPMSVDNYTAKRIRRQNESFASQQQRQRQMPPPSARNTQQYSSAEFWLPPPVENNPRCSAWLGPDIPNGEKWGSREGGGFGQLSSPNIPRKANGYGVLLDDHRRNDHVNFGGGSRAELRREQSEMPAVFHDSRFRHRGMSMVPSSYRTSPCRQNNMQATPNGRKNNARQQLVDLTTPESVHRRGTATQTSTSPGSSSMRRAPETEPTDPENDFDLEDYKSSRMQTYTPIGGVAKTGSNGAQPRNRAQSEKHRNINIFPSQFGPNLHDSYGKNPLYNTSVQRESYSIPTLPRVIPAFKIEDISGQSNPLRESSGQPANSNDYLNPFVEDDPESDEHDTIEDIMRKTAWKRKAKAAKKASFEDKLVERMGSHSIGRSTSGYSSQEFDTSNAREAEQGSTLSRIRGTDSSTLSVTGEIKRHFIIKQTTAQKAVALEKEKAERIRQRQAAETIIEREKQAKKLKEFDDLFEETPTDEAALARIKKSKEIDKARKYISEEAKIIEESHIEAQEKLEALRKRRLAEEHQAYKAAKKQKSEQRRQQDKKKEEERLKSKRRSAAEIARVQRVMEEEARLEALNKLEAERQAAKRRAATLQSFKKADNKPNSAGTPIQGKKLERVEEYGNISDDGLFVIDDVIEAVNELPNNKPYASANKNVADQPVNALKPETTMGNNTPAAAQKSDILCNHSLAQSSATPPAVQEPEDVANKEENPVNAAASAPEKTGIMADATPDANKIQAPIPVANGASISAVASDGRRRPPDIARSRVARRVSPDPIRFTGARTTRGTDEFDRSTTATTSHAPKKVRDKNMDKEERRTETKLRQTLKEVEDLKKKAVAEESRQKREWDDRFKKLREIMNPQDREDIAGGIRRADFGKNQNLTALPLAGNAKNLSLSSQIDFVSTVESQARASKKAEEERLAKYEKDKAVRRRRYDREIRVVLNGQGVEPDDEKVSRQVDEKMAIWDENRRKKERRDSGGKDIFAPPASDARQGGASPPTLTNTDDEEVKDAEAQKEQARAQAVRAGVQFLATQNKVGNNFATAASKFRIQDFDSDESEEDPDDEPETQLVSAAQPIVEEPEKTTSIEMDETLSLITLDTSIIPSLPHAPEQSKSSTAFLPDIVNPREEDMMYSYTVKHRAARENNEYETVIMGSFHSLEEANAFAQEKLDRFYLGPSTGKSETHTSDNLYMGKVITDKDKDHDEIVWVTRDIVYIGDTANIKRGDLKSIIVPKVFNVVQIMEDGEGKHVGSVIATASIRTLANKKAADRYLQLAKPSRPRIDSLKFYNDTVVPAVRMNLEEAEEKEATLDTEGVVPDTGMCFSIFVSENCVVGPLN